MYEHVNTKIEEGHEAKRQEHKGKGKQKNIKTNNTNKTIEFADAYTKLRSNIMEQLAYSKDAVHMISLDDKLDSRIPPCREKKRRSTNEQNNQ